MNTLRENVDGQAVGGDGRVRRTRSTVVAMFAAALVTGLLAATAAPAVATAASATSGDLETSPPAVAVAETTAPTSSPAVAVAQTTAPTSTPVPQNQLTPARPTPPPTGRPVRPVRPTIADPGDITSSTARFHGTGTAGHAVRVAGPVSTGSAGCSTTVRADGSWSCVASVRSGPQQVFTVQDRTTGDVGTASAPASDVVVPPTVTTSRPTNGPVSGTGYAGATVALSVSGSTADRTATVGRDGRWTISLGGATPGAGGDARPVVTTTQTASTASGYRSDLRSAASAPVTITLDRTAPAAPRITAPASGERVGDQPTTVSGTGEPGAVLTVYVDRAPVCRTDVPASGRWSCSTAGSTLLGGTRSMTATQQDAAGNFSRSSASVRVQVSQATGGPTGSSSGPATPGSGTPTATTSATGTGSGDGTGTGAPGGVATSTGAAGGSGTGTGTGSTANGATGPGDGTAAGPGSGRTGLDWSGPAGDWTAATSYDTTVPTIQAVFSWRTVLVATAVAAGFLVLIAGPLALVAGTVRGRVRNPFAGVLGRNRPRDERRRGDDVVPTWVSVTIAVAVVGLCTVLGVGVSLEARYVRLAIAVLLGAAVLTATVVLASRWAAGADRRTIGFRVSPWLVLAALVACAVTRSFDLSPAVIVGVVLVPVGRPDLDTAALRLGSSIVASARSATWRSVALLVVAAAGWILHSLTPGSGFWISFVSELAITLCVGGLGAVVATLLPLTGSAGQALLTQSRGRYVAIAAVAVALAAAVYSGAAGTHVSPVALAVIAATCTAAAVASTLWSRSARAHSRA